MEKQIFTLDEVRGVLEEILDTRYEVEGTGDFCDGFEQALAAVLPEVEALKLRLVTSQAQTALNTN